MERENRSARPGPDGRGRPLRRLLGNIGVRPAGDHRPAAWWADPAAPASRERQAEFWEEPATTSAAVAVIEPVSAPAVESVEAPVEEPAPVSLHVGSVENRHTILAARPPEKGKIMSPIAIAKFLRISGSVYDGRDEGRWFALPSRKKSVPFQFMRQVAISVDDRRAWMSSERIGSRRSDGL